MKKNNIKFKDELRHILIKYAFYPFLLFVILIILAYYLIIVNNAKYNLQAYAENITSNIDKFYLENKDFIKSFNIDIDEYINAPYYQAKINSSAYAFKKKSKTNTDVFIIDAEKNLLFSTINDSQLSENIFGSLVWELDKSPEQQFLLRRNFSQNTYSYYISSKKYDNYYVALAVSSELFHDIKLGYSVLITDRYKNTFFCSNPLLGKSLGKGYVLSQYQPKIIDINDGKYYYLNTDSKADLILTTIYGLNESIYRMRIIVLFTALSFIIIVFPIMISTKVFSDNKTKTIYQIIDFFGDKSNNSKKLVIESNDEFSIIAEKYNSMLDYQKELAQNNIEIVKQTQIAKIRQLESEFNPHFLFNTLENIRFMIDLDQDIAKEMIIYLSKLLRYSISKEDFVKLKEDIAYTKYYLKLLEFRFSDRLNYTIDDSDIDCFIPKLIIQPIIENSVKYSLDKKDSLNINISVYEENEYLYVSVLDDGIGIEENRLNDLLYDIRQNTNSNHIGLRNVNYRLHLIYGDNCDLIIKSEEGKFTEVILKIPLEKNAYLNYS